VRIMIDAKPSLTCTLTHSCAHLLALVGLSWPSLQVINSLIQPDMKFTKTSAKVRHPPPYRSGPLDTHTHTRARARAHTHTHTHTHTSTHTHTHTCLARTSNPASLTLDARRFAVRLIHTRHFLWRALTCHSLASGQTPTQGRCMVSGWPVKMSWPSFRQGLNREYSRGPRHRQSSVRALSRRVEVRRLHRLEGPTAAVDRLRLAMFS
jgi:hypothetical protein